ncbi:MAG: DEAD/DEAH box helicase [Bacteroidales bacterium]|nr:DEAD/DEAH box helicase [Bacteroidales bacterium]
MQETQITLTPSQQDAFDKIIDFVENKKDRVFILKGYAGTGKTTITKQLINTLSKMKVHYYLAASTGRASKIMSDISGYSSTTIHSMIYSYKDFNQDIKIVVDNKKDEQIEKNDRIKHFYLVFDFKPLPDHEQQNVYIIDESSMISDKAQIVVTQAQFGSGKLLSDLLEYDKTGQFIFIGDNCQLPPINQEISPALSIDYFKENFDIDAQWAELTEIMRQKGDNDIIRLSEKIRKCYFSAPFDDSNYQGSNWSKLQWRNSNNIILYENELAFLEKYSDMIYNENYNCATMLSYSNKRCNELSRTIRKFLGFRGDLVVGDLLLVTQNNLISGLMNGDLVKVKAIKSQEYNSRAGLTFIGVTVENIANNQEYQQLMIKDVLYDTKTANLNIEQQNSLFIDFIIRMVQKGVKNQKSSEFVDAMHNDEYLNALRCTYGYVLTCHKAQGGEWNDVFLSPMRSITLNVTKGKYQWIYTGMTRAKKNLHLVDDFFIAGFQNRK